MTNKKISLNKTTNADLVGRRSRVVVRGLAQSKSGTSAMSGLRSVPRTHDEYFLKSIGIDAELRLEDGKIV